jgi:hypothetical protein
LHGRTFGRKTGFHPDLTGGMLLLKMLQEGSGYRQQDYRSGLGTGNGTSGRGTDASEGPGVGGDGGRFGGAYIISGESQAGC